MTVKLTITTRSPEETFALGRALGQIVPSGTVIAMTGVLGSGKTVFVQGMARGLEVPEDFYITSPSYTLINEYPGRLTLHHADLYRLTHADDIESTGLYDILHEDGVAAVEWAERLGPEDLAEHVAVDFTVKDKGVRVIALTGYGQRSDNLLRELEPELS